MNADVYAAAVIFSAALATWVTRGLPYLLFGGKRALPPLFCYLGDVLPAAIMIILVLYCLRGIDFAAWPHGLAELISVAMVAVTQWRGKNMVISVLGGTACYMILIRTVFPV